MAKGREVLEMLIPTGGWIIYGDDFDSIVYDDGVAPITKKQFDEGFAKVDALKEQQIIEAQIAKEAAIAKLAALGLDLEDLKSLGF